MSPAPHSRQISHVSASGGIAPEPRSRQTSGGGGILAGIASLLGGGGGGHKTSSWLGGGHSSHEHYGHGGMSHSGIPDPDAINGQREAYVHSLDHQKSEALRLLETQRDQQVDFVEQAKRAQIQRLKSEIAEKAHHHEHHIKQVHKDADLQRKRAVEEIEEKIREQELALQAYQHHAHAQKLKLQREIDEAERDKEKALKEHHEEIEHETHHLIHEIEEKARQQEMALRQKYSNLQMALEKQVLEKKVNLEKQAVDLAIEWKNEKAHEEVHHHWLNKQPSVWKYFPDYAAPIDIRQTPAINGPRSGCQLTPGEVFRVSKEMFDHKLSITFLKLSDGRGWVFDSKPGVGTMCVRMDHDDHHAGHGGLGSHASVASHGAPGAHGAHGAHGTGPLVAPASLVAQLPVPGVGEAPWLSAQSLAGLSDGHGHGHGGHGHGGHGHGHGHSPPPSALPTVPSGDNMWVHKPDFLAPLQIRKAPAIDAERTEHMLMPGETFCVTDEMVGQHDVRFLKLADGRGWVFDRKPGVGMTCFRQPLIEGGAAGSAAPAPSVYASSMGGSVCGSVPVPPPCAPASAAASGQAYPSYGAAGLAPAPPQPGAPGAYGVPSQQACSRCSSFTQVPLQTMPAGAPPAAYAPPSTYAPPSVAPLPGGSYVPPVAATQPPVQVVPPTLPSGVPGYAPSVGSRAPAAGYAPSVGSGVPPPQALGSLERAVPVPVAALGSAYVGAGFAPAAAAEGLGNSRYLGDPADPMSPRVIGTRVTVYR